MNSNITNHNSVSELKQQVLNDIQRVKDDFKEIKRRATPGQIIDDVLFSGRSFGSEGTFDLLKANPVGTTFLTLGTLMLMENDSHQTWESVGKEKTVAMRDTVKSKVSGLVSKAETIVNKNTFTTETGLNDDLTNFGTDTSTYGSSDIKGKVSSKVENLKNKARGKIEGVTEGIKDKMHSAEGAIDSGKAKLSGVSSKVREKSGELFEATKQLDPLTYLALGIGLGAVTGASLPVSHGEEEVVDKLVSEKLANFTQELQGVLNQSVNIFKNEFIGGMTDFDLFK